MKYDRKFAIGPEMAGPGVHFRVWAPKSSAVAVEFERGSGLPPHLAPLTAEGGGYYSGWVEGAGSGNRYRFRLDHGSFPDPASRLQPEGPHGPSEIVASDFPWTDQAWLGRSPRELVLYEMHLGTFTREGTWRAAMEQLPELAELGITAIELMPIAEMPGQFGWGYDGVNLFAPTRLYGSPTDVRLFVDRAHQLGLMVILDVVYNHLGPDGNYLAQFSDHYFSAKQSEWGAAINFDDTHAGPVREYFISNAAYWISEFHFDGLRLDATHQIFDHSPKHIISEIAAAARTAAPHRLIYLVAENEAQRSVHIRPRELGGYGLDAIWNDDFHHSAMVAATGKAECYYLDYRGAPQEFISAAKYGFLFQGGWYDWQQKRRGTPALDLSPQNFVIFLQNHDQLANTLQGLRLHQLTSPGRFRALTALLLLLPSTPLLFQGQEFCASSPFLYFADHKPELSSLVREGRAKFLQQFRTISARETQGLLDDPGSVATFECSKLDFGEREKNLGAYTLHRDLLRLRREDATFRAPARFDGAVLDQEAFVLRFFSAQGDDRLLLVNLGRELYLRPAPEPLLAPVSGGGWSTLWSSDSPVYGGTGTPDELETADNWIIPGHAAVVLRPSADPSLHHVRISEKH
ncbi:MAG TPA: malto-oligosyltrehalose trehalohydrolase [Lacunisphaera sp.]